MAMLSYYNEYDGAPGLLDARVPQVNGGALAGAPASASSGYAPRSQQLSGFWTQNKIDPNIRGINRADELAQILTHFGITDLGQLSLKSTQTEMPGEWQTGYQNDNEIQQWVDPYTKTDYQLAYGDKTFGDLGGFDSKGRPVYLTTPAQQYLEKHGENLYRIAGSSAGKGTVDYLAQFTPEGKLAGIVPQWKSSSDWPDIRNALLTVGGVWLGGMGLESLLGAGTAAGAGGLSAADAAYALGMGETAAGAGSALGTAAAAAPVTDAATAAFLEANMGAMAPTVSSGFAGAGELAAMGGGSFTPSMNYGPGMTGAQTSAYDAVIGATGSPGLANTAANGTGLLSDAAKWMTDNPVKGRLLMSGVSGLLSASGGSSGGSGGYRDSGYRPTITRGGWQPAATPRSMTLQPTALNLPTTGQPASGLWRYGLLGG